MFLKVLAQKLNTFFVHFISSRQPTLLVTRKHNLLQGKSQLPLKQHFLWLYDTLAELICKIFLRTVGFKQLYLKKTPMSFFSALGC